MVKSKAVEIAKEVKRSDGWWQFACGDVFFWIYFRKAKINSIESFIAQGAKKEVAKFEHGNKGAVISTFRQEIFRRALR